MERAWSKRPQPHPDTPPRAGEGEHATESCFGLLNLRTISGCVYPQHKYTSN